MKGTLENKLGKVSIDSEVIAQYAGSTAVECFGIVGMAAVSFLKETALQEESVWL